MRVIAGSARRLLLKSPPGMETRPTADKYKETLFNVLQPYLYADTVFLDLFSGSGAIGIEALSRGVKTSVFVERSKPALKCIEENLEKTHLRDKAYVIAGDALSALYQLQGKYTFDVIFMDPPYHMDLEKEVLYHLADSALIHPETVIVVEVANDTDISYMHDPAFRLEIMKVKEYKTNSHIFLSVKRL